MATAHPAPDSPHPPWEATDPQPDHLRSISEFFPKFAITATRLQHGCSADSFHHLELLEWLPAVDAPSLLGKVVRNFESPKADFRPKDPYNADTQATVQCTISNANITNKVRDAPGLGVGLTELLQVSLDTSNEDRIEHHCDYIRLLRLEQANDYFEAVKTDSDTKTSLQHWLGSWRLGKQVYFITGVLTCKKTAVKDIKKTSRNIRTKGTLPLASLVAAAGGVPPVMIPFGDLHARSSFNHNLQTHFSGNIDEEMVFAIQYKVIRRKGFGKSAEVQLTDRAPSTNSHRQLGREEEEEEERKPNPKEDSQLDEIDLIDFEEALEN